jgi:HK97 family phage prohead protease
MSTEACVFSKMVGGKTIGHKGQAVKEYGSALCVKSIDTENRQIRVLASSADLDRDREKILPTAFKELLGTYKSNPVFLAAHTHRSDDGSPTVIGKAVKIWFNKKGLWAIIEFAKTELAEKYWQLYRDGFMKAVSIGFMVIEHKDEYDEKHGRIRVITKAELYEISAVAVPANPQALVKSKQRKLDFVMSKRKLSSEDAFEAAVLEAEREKNPNFDAEANEFAAALSGCKIIDGELVETDEFDYQEDDFIDEPGPDIQLDSHELDYGRLIVEETNYAELIKRD